MVKQLVEFAPGFSAYAGGVEETRFIYKEIFQDHAYNVAELPEDAFIIDAGANVGMFTLYMKKKYPSSTILAFEPAPETFDALSENVKFPSSKTSSCMSVRWVRKMVCRLLSSTRWCLAIQRLSRRRRSL